MPIFEFQSVMQPNCRKKPYKLSAMIQRGLMTAKRMQLQANGTALLYWKFFSELLETASHF
jgi:hypothetical protein